MSHSKMASNLYKSDGLQPKSDGLQPTSDGLQPNVIPQILQNKAHARGTAAAFVSKASSSDRCQPRESRESSEAEYAASMRPRPSASECNIVQRIIISNQNKSLGDPGSNDPKQSL